MDAGGEAAAVEIRRRVGRWSLVLLCAVFCPVCDDGGGTGLNPNYKEPMVWGYLSKNHLYGELTYEKYFDVFDYEGLRMVPIVLLNGSQVEPLSYSPPIEYDYGDTNPIPTYQKYELEIRHYWGTGFCHLVMPGDFHLTLPPREYILGQDSTLVSAWRPSRGAQWYWVSIFVGYDYYDTAGAWEDFEFTLDTLVYDTSITVLPERLFPAFVSQVVAGDASVTMWSGYGPADEPGDIGNVRGAAIGFVSASNAPPENYFVVVAPRLTRHAPDSRTAFERFNARLRGRMPRR